MRKRDEELAAQVRQIVESIDPRITEAAAKIDVRLGEDWRGEPAVFTTIVLKDSRAYYVWPYIHDFRREYVTRVLDMIPEDHFPFLTFSAESAALNPEVAPV